MNPQGIQKHVKEIKSLGLRIEWCKAHQIDRVLSHLITVNLQIGWEPLLITLGEISLPTCMPKKLLQSKN